MVATISPAVISLFLSLVTVANRPGYFAATSTCVASRRPLVFTIPSGISRPRRRLIRVSIAVRAFSSGFCLLRLLGLCGVNQQGVTAKLNSAPDDGQADRK